MSPQVRSKRNLK